ncbi:MAG TPA: hypothetical protein G4O02_10255 [Caldilineae bacterium]|nr:hypothetical protein [Caldilineae bacterium]
MEIGIPEAFLERMAWLLGDEYPAFLASYEEPSLIGLRVNTLKLTPEAFRLIAPFDLSQRVPWCPEGFIVPVEEHPGQHPFHAAGLYYIQDPGAMAVARLLDPQPGDWVLDLCAAPGGKATHLAALLQGEGLLIANDIDRARARILVKNMERWGARNVVVTSERPDRLVERWAGCFDRVLVDAPCSGEGMFRKSEAARQEWKPALIAGAARRQQQILEAAAALVQPGGRLAYVTCTFAPEENEGVIAHFLARHPEFEIIRPPWYPGFASGRPDWLEGDRSGLDDGLWHTVRLWPHRAPAEGHFIALMRRRGEVAYDDVPRARVQAPPASARRAYEAFCAETLTINLDGELGWWGSTLYLVPTSLPDFRGVRVLRPGLPLGAIRKGRFEPAHALAMALRATEVRNMLRLSLSDPRVFAYLRGESFPSHGDDGWVLVTVEGYPLGWGRRTRGLLKSRYPRSLRGR